MDNGGKTDFFNLGTNKGNTVKEVFSVCEKITNQKIDVEICPKRKDNPVILVVNNLKVKEILGWQPNKTLEDSILTAYNWEKKLNKEKLNIINKKTHDIMILKLIILFRSTHARRNGQDYYSKKYGRFS